MELELVEGGGDVDTGVEVCAKTVVKKSIKSKGIDNDSGSIGRWGPIITNYRYCLH